jgi:acetyl-CoA carboxylase biotin carboxylase subunit
MAIPGSRPWPACAAPLLEMAVEGISTNIPLHRELLVDAKFMAGGTNIHYLEQWLEQHKR